MPLSYLCYGMRSTIAPKWDGLFRILKCWCSCNVIFSAIQNKFNHVAQALVDLLEEMKRHVFGLRSAILFYFLFYRQLEQFKVFWKLIFFWRWSMHTSANFEAYVHHLTIIFVSFIFICSLYSAKFSYIYEREHWNHGFKDKVVISRGNRLHDFIHTNIKNKNKRKTEVA